MVRKNCMHHQFCMFNAYLSKLYCYFEKISISNSKYLYRSAKIINWTYFSLLYLLFFWKKMYTKNQYIVNYGFFILPDIFFRLLQNQIVLTSQTPIPNLSVVRFSNPIIYFNKTVIVRLRSIRLRSVTRSVLITRCWLVANQCSYVL